MDKDTTYNGWSNYETWAVKLYQDNDESWQRAAEALANRCAAIKAGRVKGKVYDEGVAIRAFKRVMSKAHTQLKRELRERGEVMEPVNWSEIVEVYVRDAEEDYQRELSQKKGE